MKIWALTRKNNKIVLDMILEEKAYEDSVKNAERLIYQACEAFDIGKPLMLSKNEAELTDFRRTVFYAADFVESIDFDTFEVEIVVEKENKKQKIIY